MIVFSADGQFAALVRGALLSGLRASDEDPTLANDQVEVWETNGGKLRRTFADFGARLRAISLSPDGRFLATTTWEVKTDRPKKMATSGLEDGEGFIRLWDVSTGELRWAKQAFGADIAIASFSPDGQRLAVIGSEWIAPGAMKLFDVQTGAVLNKENYRAQVGGLAFSPDGNTLAVRKLIYGTPRSEVKIYNCPALTERLTIEEPKDVDIIPEAKDYWLDYGVMNAANQSRLDELQHLAFSPDGRKLALSLSGVKAGELVHQICCFDTQTGKLQRAIIAHHASLPAGQAVRQRQANGVMVTRRLLPAAAESNRHAIDALVYLADSRTIVAFNRTGDITKPGDYLMVGSVYGSLCVLAWDSETGQAQWSGKSDEPAVVGAFGANGQMIAFATLDTTVSLWNSATGALKQRFLAPTGATPGAANMLNIERLVVSAEAVIALAFSADGATLAGLSDSGGVKLWDARAATLRTQSAGGESAFTCLAFSPDAARLALGEQGGGIMLLDTATMEARLEIAGNDGAIASLSFSPDGKWMAAATAKGTLQVLEAATARLTSEIAAHHGAATSVLFSPDGQRLVSAGVDGTVKLWDVATGTMIRSMIGHAAINAVAISPDGRWVASAGADKAVRLWNTETSALLKPLTGHEAAVNTVAFSPDGRLLASGSDDGAVRLWSLPEGKALRRLKGHEIAVRAVAFSPDGATLAAATGNNEIVFWDPQTGEIKRVLKEAMKLPLRKP
ncbi:MAG TPA: WD40 repeat domain-containing protein [Blastocatellia bacterium]|nr:WD40 repeat domain-containing protein [Blastocatellia bacterium]